MKTRHEYKCIQPYFGAVWTGDKTFELRESRGLSEDPRIGDLLVLREWIPEGPLGPGHYSGAFVVAVVTYVLFPSDLPSPSALDEFAVAFSFRTRYRQIGGTPP